jgi:hypothetical protein
MSSYRIVNEVKASFGEISQAPTPHAYFAEMNRLEYPIGQEARPFFHAAVALMRRVYYNAVPIRRLDLGFSYGVGAALVKYGRSFRPYHAAPVIRRGTAERHPELVEVLAGLADRIPGEVMRQLDARVDRGSVPPPGWRANSWLPSSWTGHPELAPCEVIRGLVLETGLRETRGWFTLLSVAVSACSSSVAWVPLCRAPILSLRRPAAMERAPGKLVRLWNRRDRRHCAASRTPLIHAWSFAF